MFNFIIFIQITIIVYSNYNSIHHNTQCKLDKIQQKRFWNLMMGYHKLALISHAWGCQNIDKYPKYIIKIFLNL